MLGGRMIAQVRSWLRAVMRRDRLEEGMEAELADHLARLTDDLVRSGFEPSEAARRARIALGPALMHKEAMRASLGLKWWDELRGDLRYAARLLRKSPGFTSIAAISLALAIGANTTIFSLAKQLLYDRLAVPHSEQLRMLRWDGDGKVAIHGIWGDFDSTAQSSTGTIFSYPVFEQMRVQNHSLEDLFAFKEDNMNATIHGRAQRVTVSMVSGNYYSAVGVRPQLGRVVVEADDVPPGRGSVAVISDGVWQSDFGRSPDVVGQTIRVNQIAFTIIGVNPRGFTGTKGVMETPEVFVPLSLQPVLDPKGNDSLLTDPTVWWVNVMGRAKPGVEDKTAQAELDAQMRAATRGTLTVAAGETLPHLVLEDGARGLHSSDQMFRKPVYVLLGFTGLVILLACANIANLLMARGSQRQREMSVRLAVGAGRMRIVRQLLTESLLLAVLGGAGGLLLGYGGRNVLPRLFVNPWEQMQTRIPFDWGVSAFTSAITLLTGILFGLAPAWLASRAALSSALKETGASATRRKGRGGKALVAFQLGLSTLLIVGAGLFLRTVLALSAVDVGFRTDHLMLFEIQPPHARYAAGKDVVLHGQLEERFAALPGVESITSAAVPYLAGGWINGPFLPEGESSRPDYSDSEFYNLVGVRFFATMGIPILAGRGFTSQDTKSSAKVGIINATLARKRFPNVNPIGKRFKADRDPKADWIRIVGICADTRIGKLQGDAPPQYFLPYVQQSEVGPMTYEIRSQLSPAALAPSLRRLVQGVDADLPMIDVRTQREQIAAAMSMERAFAALTTGFGVLALALACVGVYGVMAYAVSQRTNEIGIRLALGAQPAQVRGMILRESTWLALVGIASGLGGALALTRIVKSMLYGIQANDPLTFACAVLLLIAVALAAAWIPARRAAGVPPMEALRHE
jgi:predicted permease